MSLYPFKVLFPPSADLATTKQVAITGNKTSHNFLKCGAKASVGATSFTITEETPLFRLFRSCLDSLLKEHMFACIKFE